MASRSVFSTVCLLDESGDVVDRDRVVTPIGGEAMIEAGATLGEGLAARHGRRIGAVGAGVAGVVKDGVVLSASSSFTRWTGFPVHSALETRLGVPALVENDVNAFLAGEAQLGAVKGCRDALGITLGTGVGGALWLDGALEVATRARSGDPLATRVFTEAGHGIARAGEPARGAPCRYGAARTHAGSAADANAVNHDIASRQDRRRRTCSRSRHGI